MALIMRAMRDVINGNCLTLLTRNFENISPRVVKKSLKMVLLLLKVGVNVLKM